MTRAFGPKRLHFPQKPHHESISRAPDQRRTQRRPSGGRECLGLRFGFGYKDKRHTLGMTVEKVSLAVLALLGVVGLAYFIATALEVLPIISEA